MVFEENEDLSLEEFREYIFWYALAALCPEVIHERKGKFGKVVLYQLLKSFRKIGFVERLHPGVSRQGAGYWPSSWAAWVQIGNDAVIRDERLGKAERRQFRDILYPGKGLDAVLHKFSETALFRAWARGEMRFWKFAGLEAVVHDKEGMGSTSGESGFREIQKLLKPLSLSKKGDFSYQGAVVMGYEKLKGRRADTIVWFGIRQFDDISLPDFNNATGKVRLLRGEAFTRKPRQDVSIGYLQCQAMVMPEWVARARRCIPDRVYPSNMRDHFLTMVDDALHRIVIMDGTALVSEHLHGLRIENCRTLSKIGANVFFLYVPESWDYRTIVEQMMGEIRKIAEDRPDTVLVICTVAEYTTMQGLISDCEKLFVNGVRYFGLEEIWGWLSVLFNRFRYEQTAI